jgi:CelD/BcsL family acetyltransferase involved in cellulose biosynthesis
MNRSRVSPALRVELVRDAAGFAALREAWNVLVRESRDSVFLRHEWLDAAWQWCQPNARLAVFVVREGGRLVGAMPCMTVREERARLTVNVLRLLTVPDTQLADVICRPADAQPVGQALAEALHEHRALWDALVFEYVPADSPGFAALLDVLRGRRLRTASEPFGTNWSIGLGSGWTAYYATRSRRLKKSNNNLVNRLERAGEVAIVQLAAPMPASEVLSTIAPISQASWKASTGTTFDQSGPQRFITRLTEHALAQGWLSVWALTIDGRPTAYEYQLRYGDKLHGLRSDFDERIAPGLSPGSYLNFKLIQRLFDSGAETYFLGPGNNTYKLHWTEGGMPLERILVYGNSLRGRLLYWMQARLQKWWRSRRRTQASQARPQGAEADEQPAAGKAPTT